jgi:hypothetical protein
VQPLRQAVIYSTVLDLRVSCAEFLDGTDSPALPPWHPRMAVEVRATGEQLHAFSFKQFAL